MGFSDLNQQQIDSRDNCTLNFTRDTVKYNSPAPCAFACPVSYSRENNRRLGLWNRRNLLRILGEQRWKRSEWIAREGSAKKLTPARRPFRALIRRAVKRAGPSKKVWCSRLGSTKSRRFYLPTRELWFLKKLPSMWISNFFGEYFVLRQSQRVSFSGMKTGL